MVCELKTFNAAPPKSASPASAISGRSPIFSATAYAAPHALAFCSAFRAAGSSAEKTTRGIRTPKIRFFSLNAVNTLSVFLQAGSNIESGKQTLSISFSACSQSIFETASAVFGNSRREGLSAGLFGRPSTGSAALSGANVGF